MLGKISPPRMIELRNKAETNLRATEKGLKDGGEKLSAEGRLAIESAVGVVKQAASGNDPEQLQRALDQLDAVTRPLAEILLDSVVAAEVTGKRVDDAR